jgi:tripartite ATP-independent transporter DctP family solute receptor
LISIVLGYFLGTGETSAASNEIIMKIAYPFGATPDHPHYWVGNNLKKTVEELTKGRVTVQLYPMSQLGGDRETSEAIIMGTLEMNWPASAPIAQSVPEIGALDLPYIFRDVNHAFRALDGKPGKIIESKCLDKGIRIGGWGLSGFRHVMTTKKPINKLEDIRGLKIRCMEAPVFIEMLKAWGAIPTPISWTEVYMALSQGVVDGQETVINAAMDQKHLEVTKYIALTYDSITLRPLIISEKWWRSLPSDIQTVVGQATKEATAMMRQKILEFEDQTIEMAQKKYKVTITKPDLKPWREATKKIYPKFEKVVGGSYIIDAIQAVE